MLNTIATIVTGAMIAIAPVTPEETTHESLITSATVNAEEVVDHVSFAVSVNSTTEELDDIQAAAEAAGMGFTYKKRGVKTRLVIDMVIETEEDYTMDRVVIKEEDGTRYLGWSLDGEGQAVSFIQEDKLELTHTSK